MLSARHQRCVPVLASQWSSLVRTYATGGSGKKKGEKKGKSIHREFISSQVGKKPVLSPEQAASQKQIADLYNRNMMLRLRAQQKEETLKLRLQKEAFDALPAELQLEVTEEIHRQDKAQLMHFAQRRTPTDYPPVQDKLRSIYFGKKKSTTTASKKNADRSPLASIDDDEE